MKIKTTFAFYITKIDTPVLSSFTSKFLVHNIVVWWKTLEGPVVIGGDSLPSPLGIGLTDLPNIGPPGSDITDEKLEHM